MTVTPLVVSLDINLGAIVVAVAIMALTALVGGVGRWLKQQMAEVATRDQVAAVTSKLDGSISEQQRMARVIDQHTSTLSDHGRELAYLRGVHDAKAEIARTAQVAASLLQPREDGQND